MKIGTVIPWFPSHVSGEKLLGVFYYRQSKKLVEMGHEIFIITVQRPNMPKFEVMDGILVYRFPSYMISKIRYDIPNFLKLTQIIQKVCNEHKLDMLEFATPDFLTSIPILYIKKRINIPTIVTVHELRGISCFSVNKIVFEAAHIYTNLLGKWIIRAADGVRLVNSSLRNDLLRFGINENKMEIIHMGTDINIVHSHYDKSEIRRELGIDDKDIFVLFAGRLTEIKGTKYLIEAVRDLVHKYSNLKLVIVGDGDVREANESMASSIKNNIIFTGYVKDVHRFMSSADVFVSPSLCEGGPITVYEAMACGTSVIATRVGAVPDAIQNGKTGIIIEPKNVNELKQALITLIENPNLAREMSKLGQERIEKEFTWGAICKKLEKFYRKTIESYKRGDNNHENRIFCYSFPV